MSLLQDRKPVSSVSSWRCLGEKRRAKPFPLKSVRKAKSEGLRNMPAADKGAPRRGGSEELALKLLARLPWILCLSVPSLPESREKSGGLEQGRAAFIPEITPVTICPAAVPDGRAKTHQYRIFWEIKR